MFEQFKLVGRKMFEEGLVGSHCGSLSIRQGDKIIITRKNVMLSELDDDCFVEVPVAGDNNSEASAELLLHRSIYMGSTAKAVIHAKPVYAMAMAVHEEKINPLDFDAKNCLRYIPVIRVRDPLSIDELNRFLLPALKNGHPCSIIRGYGSFSIGNDLMEAYMYLSVAERACKIVNFSRSGESSYAKRDDKPKPQQRTFRSAIPPSIGVMDRSYRRK